MNKNQWITRTISLSLIFLLLTPASGCFGEELDWVEKGYGKSKKTAVFNAKWSIITKALEEVLGDQAQEVQNLKFFKTKFENDELRYLRKYKIIYTRKEKGKYAAKVHGSIEMATIRTDAALLINKSGGNRRLPSIAINSKNQHMVGLLAQKFKNFGYVYIDYQSKIEKLVVEYQSSIEKFIDQNPDKIDTILKSAGVDYLLTIPLANYKSEEKNKITGENSGSLTFQVKIISTKLSADVLVAVQDTVTQSSFERTKEQTYAKAVELIFNKVNSQIIRSWEKSKSLYTAYLKNVNEEQYFNIVDILVEVIGDDNPREKTDPILGRKVFFKLTKPLNFKTKRLIRTKVKSLNIKSIRFEDNTIFIEN